jgi:hypothetical protein
MRRLITYLAALVGLAMAAFIAVPLAAASASPTPPPTAQGHVALSGPLQYVKFAAFGQTRHHGWVDYSNFTYAAPGTNVWNIGKATSLTFTLGGTAYAHTIKTLDVKALSPESTAFFGTGVYNADNSVTWTMRGLVHYNALSFSIRYTGTNAGYRVHGHGQILGDGSVSGTARASDGNTLGFTMPPGSAFSVLHYRTAVTFAFIQRHHNARFGFTIPASAPVGLAGLNIIVKVHDGGFPGQVFDTYGHGVATSLFNGPVTNYPITSGDIIVHR